jgi:hypothetical protein
VTRRRDGAQAGQELLVGLQALDAGVDAQLAHVELGQRVEARWLFQGPGQLPRADPDPGLREQREVHRMVVVRVGQHHIGHVLWRHSGRAQLAGEFAPHAEGTDVDQDDATEAAQQRHRAPAQPAVAHRLAGEALHQHIDLVHGYSTLMPEVLISRP